MLLVGGVGVIVHQPLARVPENTIKFAVGLMLVSFGTFWGGEGIGVNWRLGDSMILLLLGVYALIAWAFVRYFKREWAATLLLTPTEGAS